MLGACSKWINEAHGDSCPASLLGKRWSTPCRPRLHIVHLNLTLTMGGEDEGTGVKGRAGWMPWEGDAGTLAGGWKGVCVQLWGRNTPGARGSRGRTSSWGTAQEDGVAGGRAGRWPAWPWSQGCAEVMVRTWMAYWWRPEALGAWRRVSAVTYRGHGPCRLKDGEARGRLRSSRERLAGLRLGSRWWRQLRGGGG